MSKTLWQVRYQIEGLLPEQAKLTRKVWLKKGEILLEKKGEHLNAHLLHEGEHTFGSDEKILPYLKFSPLISNNSIHVDGGGGFSIPSKKDLGKNTEKYVFGEARISYPNEAIEQIESHIPQFLREIRRLHDRYIDVVQENKFLATAIDFFYDANNKSVFDDDGFICAVICLEALFNEGPSDISYKIAHRAAFLLGLGKSDGIEVFQNIKAIYKARNKLIHGRGTLSTDCDATRYEVMQYARVSIMIFLVLLKKAKRQCPNKNNRKENLLREIDHAMLDIVKREALQREITTGMKNFVLKVPRTFEGNGERGHYRVTAW